MIINNHITDTLKAESIYTHMQLNKEKYNYTNSEKKILYLILKDLRNMMKKLSESSSSFLGFINCGESLAQVIRVGGEGCGMMGSEVTITVDILTQESDLFNSLQQDKQQTEEMWLLKGMERYSR